MTSDAQPVCVKFVSRSKSFILLVDTGAAVSLLCKEIVSDRSIDPHNAIKVKGISGKPFVTMGSTKVKFDGRNFKGTVDFQVLPPSSGIKVDGILGTDFLSQHNVDICFSDSSLIFNKYKTRVPLLYCDRVTQTLPPQSICYVEMLTTQKVTTLIERHKFEKNIYLTECIQTPNYSKLTLVFENHSNSAYVVKNFCPTMQGLDDNFFVLNCVNDMATNASVSKGSDLSDDIEKRVSRLFTEYDDIIAKGDVARPARTETQKIYLKPNTVPRYIKQYRLPPSYSETIAKKVRKMVQNNLAEPSVSSWNSPVLLVPKKGAESVDDYRLVIDYRRLNDVLEDDKYPIPDINEILDGLGKAKYFSTIDLDQGYYQISLDKASRPYTAFTTSDGHFQLTRMPMGLKTSPPVFSRIMRTALGDLVGKICYIYLDDVIIYGSTINDHERNLRQVLERLRKIGLQINFKKCKFFKTSVSFLGHIVSDEGLKPDPEKFSVIKDWPTPRNVKEVQSFLGLLNYYRRFVKDFATIAKPLYTLTKKDTVFLWTADCEKAFNQLKYCVCNPPALAYPDFSQPFIIQTDASETGLGAVIMNYDKRPVAFLSHTLSKTQQAYHITDKELLAIVFALKKWNNYLLGQKFIVQTDHKALEELFKMKDPSSRLTRYRLLLEQYDFTIQYMKGKKNVVADALSRVNLHINDLKMMNVNILTRLQKRKLSDIEVKNETKDDTLLNEPIITRLLRRQKDIPLLKFCNNLKEIPNYATEKVIVDNSNLIGYFPILGELYLQVPTTIPKNRLKDVLHDVKIALWRMSGKIDKKKFCIFENELNVFGESYKNILKYLGKNDEDKLSFSIIPDVEYVKDEKKKKEIIRRAHSLPTGGHFGIEKMYKTLKLNFYWPNMIEDVKQCVKACELCQKKKHSRVPKTPMTITDTAESTFDKIYMDLVGPLPESHSGNKYVLTLQDDLSKFLWCYPIPDKSANVVARALVEKFFLPYHFPKFLVSDCGLEFVNKVQKSVCGLLKIEQITSAPYHHQSIGSLENSHKSLNSYLRTYSDEDKYNWDLWMPYFSYAYNSTVHMSTKYTPFELIFGKNNMLPDGTLKALKETSYNYEDYLLELKHRLKIAIADAKEFQLKAKMKRKIEYDRSNKVKTKNFQIGDYVLMKTNNNNKLENIYEGPYEIKKINGKNIILEIKKKEYKTNIDNIKSYYTVLHYWIDFHS